MTAPSPNGLPYLDMRVVFDDGRELATHADQRDMRRAQLAIAIDPELDPLGFNRACAWAYLTRLELIEDGWAEFDEQVAFVIPPDDAEQTTADPTETARAE